MPPSPPTPTPAPSVPKYWRWVSYIDFLRYSWGCLTVNQFGDERDVMVSGPQYVFHLRPPSLVSLNVLQGRGNHCSSQAGLAARLFGPGTPSGRASSLPPRLAAASRACRRRRRRTAGAVIFLNSLQGLHEPVPAVARTGRQKWKCKPFTPPPSLPAPCLPLPPWRSSLAGRRCSSTTAWPA